MAKTIVGMEVASDLHDLPMVCGIATNYFEWRILKRSDASVQVNIRIIWLDEDHSLEESLGDDCRERPRSSLGLNELARFNESN